MKSDTILNVAAGKIDPLYLEDSEKYFIVNVDTKFYSTWMPSAVEANRYKWDGKETQSYNLNADVFEFMDQTALWFERVCVYRFLEHIPMDKILYFIYLISRITKPGAEIDVIVPNYETLAKKIINEEQNIKDNLIEFESHNIELTTELLNEPCDPHASIWTPWRLAYFFELEGRFKVFDTCAKYDFDGRNLYLRGLIQRL